MHCHKKKAVLAAGIMTALTGGTALAAAPASITLSDSYVKADYEEVSRLKDTKQVIVIQKKDMEGKGYSTLSDVLDKQTSINVGKAGYGKIDIRGQGGDESDRNLVIMVDGAPVTNMTSHPWNMIYDVVPVENINKIEIIPGGGSVLYGSGASGGVINITTDLKNMTQHGGSVSTEWNSDGYRASISDNVKASDNLTISAGATKIKKDLQFDNTWRNSTYEYAGLRWDIDPTQYVTFRASHMEDDGQYLSNITLANLEKYGRHYRPSPRKMIAGHENGKFIYKTVSGYNNADASLDSYNLTYQKQMGKNWVVNGDFFYDTGDFSNNYFDDDQITHHTTRGMRLKADHAYGNGHHILFGYDDITQKQNLSYVGSYLKGTRYHFNYERKSRALYALNTLKYGKYEFTQGLRREKTDWSFFDVANNVSGDDTSKRWDTAGELSAAYHYNDTGRVYVRYERGYTGPDSIQVKDGITEGRTHYYVPTSAKDEKYDLYELGWRDKIGVSTVNVTLFESYTGNQMNRYYLGPVMYPMYTMNLLSTRRRGVDISLKQRTGKLKVSEGYTWLLGRSKWNSEGREFLKNYPAKYIDYTKAGLTKVPKHKIRIEADYDFNKRWSTGLDWTFYGKYINYLSDADKADDGLMHSYGLVDWNLTLHVNKDLTVYGGINNLFNKDYYEYGNGMGPWQTLLPGYERTYYIGMNYKF